MTVTLLAIAFSVSTFIGIQRINVQLMESQNDSRVSRETQLRHLKAQLAATQIWLKKINTDLNVLSCQLSA